MLNNFDPSQYFFVGLSLCCTELILFMLKKTGLINHRCEWSADIWCLVSFESFILITEPTKSNQKGQKTRLCFVHLFTKSRSGRNSKYDICINLSGCLHHHSCFCSFCLCENLPQHTEWERCQSCLPACPLPSSRLLAWLLSAPHPAERGNEWSHTDKHKHLLYVSTNNKCIVMWPSKKKRFNLTLWF